MASPAARYYIRQKSKNRYIHLSFLDLVCTNAKNLRDPSEVAKFIKPTIASKQVKINLVNEGVKHVQALLALDK